MAIEVPGRRQPGCGGAEDVGLRRRLPPVGDGAGQVVGMVTDRDICMAALTRGQPLHEIRVSVPMGKAVLSCLPDATLVEAEEIKRSGRVRRLPVIDYDA